MPKVFNKTMVIGKLVTEPELIEFGGGGKVWQAQLRITGPFRRRSGGQEEAATYIWLKGHNRRHAFKQLADELAGKFVIGDEVFAIGKLAEEMVRSTGTRLVIDLEDLQYTEQEQEAVT